MKVLKEKGDIISVTGIRCLSHCHSPLCAGLLTSCDFSLDALVHTVHILLKPGLENFEHYLEPSYFLPVQGLYFKLLPLGGWCYLSLQKEKKGHMVSGDFIFKKYIKTQQLKNY